MKIAILGESEADEAAFKVLAEAVLGGPLDLLEKPSLQSRGWPAVMKAVEAAIKHLYYHTEAEGFVFVVDSNHSTPHEPAHNYSTDGDNGCRLCQIRRAVHKAKRSLRPIHSRQPLKTAVGLAVPSIEAWLQCGVNPAVTEAAWINGIKSKTEPYTKLQLKQNVYGTNRPSLPLETKRMLEEATRLGKQISTLENLFPLGFGAFSDDIRGWRVLNSETSYT
jgi:hypothetical protein